MNNKNLIEVEMREKANYSLAKGMIDVSKKSLDSLAISYSRELNSLNDDMYRIITVSILAILEQNNAASEKTHETLNDNAISLRSSLEKELVELVQISSSLSKILDEKMGNQLLGQIKSNGTKNETDLSDYITKTASAGQTLSNSSFPNIERQIDSYNKKLINDLKIQDNLVLVEKIMNCLNNSKIIYLYKLSNENKIMFGNFANLVDTAGTYFINYAKSVDDLIANKTFNRSIDELGVPNERKSLIENLQSARELYLADEQKTK